MIPLCRQVLFYISRRDREGEFRRENIGNVELKYNFETQTRKNKQTNGAISTSVEGTGDIQWKRSDSLFIDENEYMRDMYENGG